MNTLQRAPRRKRSPYGDNSRQVSTVIIGAGHAGLAMSALLSGAGIDHVVLERGEIANSWKRERWDSLKLLTPNWLCRLPGFAYGQEFAGTEADGFMSMPEVCRFIEHYAAHIDAPVRCGVTVREVHPTKDGYQVMTNDGNWRCRSLVIATGAFALPCVPAWAQEIPGQIQQLTSQQYRHPAQLPEGEVLVVVGSATGLQLALEIQRSGRPVTLATGEHVRMPRHYRGRDIFWWMQQTGVADEIVGETDDTDRLRNLPSPQLIGDARSAIFDLNQLQQGGVKITGRLMRLHQQHLQFSGGLANVCKLADLKMQRLLDRFDRCAEQLGVRVAAETFAPTQVPAQPLLSLPVTRVRTIVWATGYRPDYSWLKVPVLDRKGNLKHRGGIVEAPGMYVLGLPSMRRRSSSYLYGINEDAHDLAAHLCRYLENAKGVSDGPRPMGRVG